MKRNGREAINNAYNDIQHHNFISEEFKLSFNATFNKQ